MCAKSDAIDIGPGESEQIISNSANVASNKTTPNSSFSVRGKIKQSKALDNDEPFPIFPK